MDNQYLNIRDLNEFLDYIRKAADGNESVYDFLKENHQKLDFMEHTGNNSDDYNKHRYIVVDPKITETKKRNPAKDFDTVRSINPLRPGAVSWEKNTVSDVTETIKVVDIYDPACKVQDLVIRTYESYQKGNKAGDLTRNCVNQSHNYVAISGHTPTNEDRLGVNDQGQLIVRGYKEKITEVLKGIGNGFLDKLKSLITMK